MSLASEYATVTTRLAWLPNIARARHDDVIRLERHGDNNGDHLAAKVAQIQKDIAKLQAKVEALVT